MWFEAFEFVEVGEVWEADGGDFVGFGLAGSVDEPFEEASSDPFALVFGADGEVLDEGGFTVDMGVEGEGGGCDDESVEVCDVGVDLVAFAFAEALQDGFVVGGDWFQSLEGFDEAAF